MKSNMTFVEKITAFIKGGDQAKLIRFDNKLNKYINKQIAIKEEKIDNLRDKIGDAEEVLTETILNVDLTAIDKTDGSENYCAVYTSKILDKMDISEKLANDIANLQLEVEKLQELKNTINSVEVIQEKSK